MRIRQPQVIYHFPAEIKADAAHLYIVIKIKDMEIGIRFSSPEQLLDFFTALMEKAKDVWPLNEWIKEYLREDDVD